MKLKQVSSKKLVSFLETKGFILNHIKGDHLVLIKEGVARIVVPRRNPLPKGTLRAILREANISREEYEKGVYRKSFINKRRKYK